jgi:uncharacterized protein YggE
MTSLFRSAAMALTLAIAAAPALASAQTLPAADDAFRATTFNLSAYGETRVAPDMATITLGVTSTGQTAASALQANTAKMTEAVAAIRRSGVPDRDIQTSGLSVSPQYAYVNNQPPRLTGYQASNQVTITVRDLTRLGAVIDATVGAGANTVSGIAFGLQNPAAAEDAARQEAVHALQAKADLYARATGYHIVRVVNLSEGGGYTPPQPRMYAMRGAIAGVANDETPVAAGELRVRIDVNAVYEAAR